jgi:hypothetical protein
MTISVEARIRQVAPMTYFSGTAWESRRGLGGFIVPTRFIYVRPRSLGLTVTGQSRECRTMPFSPSAPNEQPRSLRRWRLAAQTVVAAAALSLASLFLGPLRAEGEPRGDTSFSIAVIPDTQNYLDHTHQRAGGFAFDASEMFLEQMRFVARLTPDAGGDVRFVTAVGDIWQSRVVPAESGAKPKRSDAFGLTPVVAASEAPAARAGYSIIAPHVPFAVVPGNHDYDWSLKDGDRIRVGGLVNFQQSFGADSPFFRGKPWYVASHEGGADNAQIFVAGGYRFLHIGLQFDPSDASLSWAEGVVSRYPGLPTIVSMHRFIDNDGKRPDDVVTEGAPGRADYNSPEQIWQKLIRGNDQIFLVLSGHYAGQARRVDGNAKGHQVWQILSDYQNRRQAAVAAGITMPANAGVGDGWLRLMRFELGSAAPTIRVRTYSTHYRQFSVDAPGYAGWYRPTEKSGLSDDGSPGLIRTGDHSINSRTLYR